MSKRRSRFSLKGLFPLKVSRSLKIRIIALSIVAFLAITAGGGYAVSRSVSADLPHIVALKDYKPPLGTQIFSEDDHLIGRIKVDKGIFVPLSQIPDTLKKAVVCVEDARFYEHEGIDLQGILRAVFKDIISARLKEGGSTITQQLAKVIFLTPEKSFKRKLKEMFLARKMEKELSKDDILELYLNKVYFGHGSYGVEMAARTYFGKHVGDLDLAESAVIAGLVRSPKWYSPYNDMEQAKKRQAVVLARMVDEKAISRGQADAAIKETLKLDNLLAREEVAPHLVEQIRIYLEDKYGPDKVYNEGLKVRTTINYRLQLAAQKALEKGIKDHQGRQFADKERQEKERLKKELRDKKAPKSELAKIDRQSVKIDPPPFAQGALVAIDPYTGYVKALVGGVDYPRSEYNHAILARRQPGSAFKPFVYAAAMDAGFTPASIIEDVTTSYDEGKWNPRNYDAKYEGSISLRDALVNSKNVPTVALMNKVGVDDVIELVKRLGIKGPFSRDLTLALGSCSVTPMELVSAYCAFANGGYRPTPITVLSVSDSRGRTLEASSINVEQVMSTETAYLVTSMLKDVVTTGTAKSARWLGMPVAGKTGTTSKYVDAWFVGYNTSIVAGVWVGYDDQKSLGRGEAGARAALPVWLNFMASTKGDSAADDFPVPEGIEFVEVDRATGLLPGEKTTERVVECFKKGTAPGEKATETAKPPQITLPDNIAPAELDRLIKDQD